MNEVVNDTYNKCLLEMQCYTMFDYIRLLDARIQRMQGSDSAEVRKMNFGIAIMALKAGYPVRRSGWNGKGLWVIKQVPAHITEEIIPEMQSLPQSAKDLIIKGKGFIDYTSQCLIYNENTGRACNGKWHEEAKRVNGFPSCINSALILAQTKEIQDIGIGALMERHQKFCLPIVSWDGSIRLGESEQCKVVANITEPLPDINQKLIDFRPCGGCDSYKWHLQDPVTEQEKTSSLTAS